MLKLPPHALLPARRDFQKGNKVVQTLCAEGKARNASSLTSKVRCTSIYVVVRMATATSALPKTGPTLCWTSPVMGLKPSRPLICQPSHPCCPTPPPPQVPAAKRAIERFIFQMKAFQAEVGDGATFWIGQLKHRDIRGKQVASQVCVTLALLW